MLSSLKSAALYKVFVAGRKKEYRILVAAILVCLLAGCKKYNSTSDCIESKVAVFSKSEALCSDATVKEYSLEGKLVYIFDTGSCLAYKGADVYGTNCNYLGTVGGFASNGKIDGVDFSSNARYRATIWSNR